MDTTLSIEECAFMLLQKITNLNQDGLSNVFDHIDVYTTHHKKKRSGGFRTIEEPYQFVKDAQERILKTFLYRMVKRRNYYKEHSSLAQNVFYRGVFADLLDPGIHGMIPKKSIVTAARVHCSGDHQFILKMDLKDAFHSVTMDIVEDTLYPVILNDCKAAFYTYKEIWDNKPFYQQEKKFEPSGEKKIKSNIDFFPKYSFFPQYRFHEFREYMRSLVREGVEFDDTNIASIIKTLCKLIATIVCFKNRLPQGAPTSGFLLNMVVSQSKLLGFLGKLKEVDDVSIYVDDIIICMKHKPTLGFIKTICNHISATRIFEHHPNKIRIYDLRKNSATVLGMKIARVFLSHSEMSKIQQEQVAPRGFERAERTGRLWQLGRLTLSKKKQKQYRALFHRLNNTEHADDTEMNKAIGYHGHIVSIYGWPTSYMPSALNHTVLLFRKKYLNKTQNNTLLVK